MLAAKWGFGAKGPPAKAGENDDPELLAMFAASGIEIEQVGK